MKMRNAEFDYEHDHEHEHEFGEWKMRNSIMSTIMSMSRSLGR